MADSRMARRSVRDDSGGAMVEFVAISLLLLVPVVYLVVVLGRVQAGAFAAETAASDAARGAVVEGVKVVEAGRGEGVALAEASGRAEAIVAVVADDFGFESDDVDLTLTCTASPCFAPGGNLVATVTINVGLPGIPGVISNVVPTTVTVTGTARSPIDGLAGDRP